MLKLSIINPYDTNLNTRILSDVDFKGITDLTLCQLALNQPYQLKINLTSEFSYYEEFLTNPIFNSLKIQTDYVNLGFIMADGKRKLGLQSEYTLFSSSQKLARTISYPDQTYSGSLAGFLANLSNDFVFTGISTEPNDITIETGAKNDLELLNEAMSRVDFFAWRENGLIDVGGGVLKPQILYGNFGADINNYYNASPTTRKEAEPLVAYKTINADDPYNPSLIQIDDISNNFNFNYYNKLYIYTDTGQGMAQNSRIPVVPNTYNSQYGVVVNPSFPLLQTTKQGRIYYYLQVPGVNSEPNLEKNLIYSASGNTQDSVLNQVLTPAQSAQRAYQDAINYARSQIKNNYYSIKEGDLKRICLPGNTVNVSFNEGSKFGINIQENYLLNPISDLNLMDIQN